MDPLKAIQTTSPVLALKRNNITKPVTSVYFSSKDTKENLLTKIDEYWRIGILFERAKQPNSNFYSQYIEELKHIVTLPKNDFSEFSKGSSNQCNFINEFIALSEKSDLTLFQRAVTLTQALELALLGIDPSPVLEDINNNSYISKLDDRTMGYRNELLAGWFLAKFIYQLDPNESFQFLFQDMIRTVHRDFDNKVIQPNKKPYRREVDIHTEDALVSVKSGKNSFAGQVRDLVFITTDSLQIGGDLKDRIRKIILLKTAENLEQLTPDFKHNMKYQKLKELVIKEGRKHIEEFDFPITNKEKFLACYNRLTSSHSLDIYFLPQVDNVDAIQTWIEDNYIALDEEEAVA